MMRDICHCWSAPYSNLAAQNSFSQRHAGGISAEQPANFLPLTPNPSRLDSTAPSHSPNADMDFPPLDFDRIRTYPIRERPNKVHLDELARVWKRRR